MISFEVGNRLLAVMSVEDDGSFWSSVVDAGSSADRGVVRSAPSDGGTRGTADSTDAGRVSKRGCDSSPPAVRLTNGLAS